MEKIANSQSSAEKPNQSIQKKIEEDIFIESESIENKMQPI